MSLLDEIIEGATDDSLSTANLLRKVQVAAARLGATDIVEWTKHELNGYKGSHVELPANRAARRTRVEGVFSGPMRSFMTHDLPQPVGRDGWDQWFEATFPQPVAELEAFAAADDDSKIEWPAPVVSRYEDTGAFSLEYHGLYTAHIVLTRQMLRGLIDSIRNTALDFAITLQLANADAGSVGGPTIESDPNIASVVYNITNNVTGHGTNIAAGDQISQTSTVNEGDRFSLTEELRKLGLVSNDVEAFADALDADRRIDGLNVQSFLDRVKSGAITVATDVSTKVITSQIAMLALQYLGQI
jgi:hypothetical protein